MAQYQPSYVDVSGFSKAISEAAYKAQQLAMKQDELMNRAIDNQFKMYSGKLRKEDSAKFDSYFSDYSQALKNYQRLNRRGGMSSEIREASETAAEKKRMMLDFVDRSAKYGQVQLGMGKLYKDGGKLINKSKYNDVYSSLDKYDSDQLDELYGGVDKVPMDFELKKEDINPQQYFSTIRQYSNIGNLSKNKIEQKKIDPVTNQQVTRSVSIDGVGEVQVPIVEVIVGLSPEEARNAVWASSIPGTKFQDAPSLYLKDINDGLQSDNPQIRQQSQDLLNRAMQTYGIKDPSQVTGVDILAQSILDQSQQKIEIEDWRTLKNVESIIKGREALKLSKAKFAMAAKAFNDAKNNASLKQGQALLNFGKTLVESGLVYDKDFLDFGNNILSGYGLNLTPEVAEQYKIMQGAGKTKVAGGVAESYIFTPSIWGGVPKQ